MCDYSATQKSNFKNHKGVHETICVICVTTMQHYRVVLKTHKEAVHESVKYMCTMCNCQETDKGNFNRHEKSIHEGVICVICVTI